MRLVATLGNAPLHTARETVAITRLLLSTIGWLFRGKRDKGAIVEQMYAIGNRSVFFMSVTMGVIGIILVYQSGMQVKRLVPDFTMVGATFIKFLVRDLAASIGAMPLATRVGAGMAAEIGSMVVTEQVDALKMCAADPVDYLVVPRFVASVIMSTAVLIWACGVAFFAGMITANQIFDVSFSTFMNFSMVTGGDVALGLIKCVTYGSAIAIVSCHRGLATFGGSAGVGWATTTAVVYSCFAIIVLNFFLSTIGYFVLPA